MASFQKVVNETFLLGKQIAKLSTQYNENRVRIQNFLDKKKENSFEVDLSELDEYKSTSFLLVNKRERMTIQYFVDKLRQKLSPDIQKQVIVKTYVVKEMGPLIALAKQAGMSPKDFKDLFEITEEVDKKALNQLFSTGKVTMDQLKGCYMATLSKWFEIKEKKEKDA